MASEHMYMPGKRAGPLGTLYQRQDEPVAAQSTKSPGRKLLEAFKTASTRKSSQVNSAGAADPEAVSGLPQEPNMHVASTSTLLQHGGTRAGSDELQQDAPAHHSHRSFLARLTRSPTKSSKLAAPAPVQQHSSFIIFEDAQGSASAASVQDVAHMECDELENDENAPPPAEAAFTELVATASTSTAPVETLSASSSSSSLLAAAGQSSPRKPSPLSLPPHEQTAGSHAIESTDEAHQQDQRHKKRAKLV